MSKMPSDDNSAPQWEPGGFGWSLRRVDGAVVVRVAGELDLSTSAEWRRKLMKLAESDPYTVAVLDLSDVQFIDAHSVGLIVAACSAARKRGRRLEVDGLQGIPAVVFRRLGLEPLLARRRNEEMAGRNDADGRAGQAATLIDQRRSTGGTSEAR